MFVFGRWLTNDKGEATLRKNVITDVDAGLRAKSVLTLFGGCDEDENKKEALSRRRRKTKSFSSLLST